MCFVISFAEKWWSIFGWKVWLLAHLPHAMQVQLIAGVPAVWYAGLASHEVGHLVGNRVFGVKATGMRVGDGPVVTLFRNSGFRFEIGLKPTTGHLYIPGPPAGKWQAIIAYAAGPFAAILFAAVMWALVPAGALSWYWKLTLVLIAAQHAENLLPYAPDGHAIFDRLRGTPTRQTVDR
ncbi:site-2 protease family protein [Paraburkholderia tropica]|uniref:site-2 protease family protein n=1 Tax=Paraburkholderia tropica TaxID=92647 RepID=UPI001CC53BB5|nr:site-2 protease family protein [Paraburkholderia tropica]